MQFKASVRRHFQELLSSEFEVAKEDDCCVLFRKGDLEIEVRHDPRSSEISLSVGGAGATFSMSELMRVSDPAAADTYRNYAAATQDATDTGMKRLAGLFFQYGESVLAGDELIWPRLRRQREAWAKHMELRSKAPAIRQRANRAFALKDYSLAANLFAQVEAHLSEADRAKLRISRQKLD